MDAEDDDHGTTTRRRGTTIARAVASTTTTTRAHDARCALDAARRRARALRAAVEAAMGARDFARAATGDDGTTRTRSANAETRRSAALGLETVIARERRDVATVRASVEARERWIREATTALRDARRAAFEVEVPIALAEAESDLREITPRVGRETSRVMRQLRALVPVVTEVGDRSASSSRQPGRPGRRVRACGCKVPDAFDGEGFDANELAGGLGAMLHFATLASRYLDAPRLHRGSHAGSRSYVWAPTSAWDDAASSVWENNGTVHVRDFAGANAERLALFLPRAVVDGSVDTASERVQESRLLLKRAMRLLARSVAATCAHQARECGVVAPVDMGPFSQLCALTAHVARGNQEGSTLPAAARVQTPPHVLHNSTNDAAGARRGSPELLDPTTMMQSVVDGAVVDAHASSAKRSPLTTSIIEAVRSRWLCERPPSRGHGFTAIEEDEFENVDDCFFVDLDCDDGIDDWESMRGERMNGGKPRAKNASVDAKPPRSLVLPPPPSSVDIEQWERAMLIDNQR